MREKIDKEMRANKAKEEEQRKKEARLAINQGAQLSPASPVSE